MSLPTNRMPGDLIQAVDINQIAEAVNALSDDVASGPDGTTDHAALTNRDADDQHPIGAITGLQSELNGKAATEHGHTIGDVQHLQTALDNKAEGGHTHDDRYYTESEVNTALEDKADATHQHPVTDLTATGTPDDTTFLRGDGAWATPEGGGGGDPALLDYAIYALHGKLPGRPITAGGYDVSIAANIAIGSIFRLPIPAKIDQIVCSVREAATTAGATGRVAVYSWEWDGTCTLVQDHGTVAIDVATQQVYASFAGSFLPAGVYVAVFIPEADVKMRMLSVYDALLGFQNGQEFNMGSARVLAYPMQTLGSYPSSAPATLTMAPSTDNGGIAGTSRSWCTIRTALT